MPWKAASSSPAIASASNRCITIGTTVRLAFASEIKALFKLPDMPRRLDYRALADYLTLGYPLAPATFFADIRELRPGHWLKLCGDKLQEDCYWSWHRDEQDWSEAETLAKAKETLLVTLEEHMIADVPIGALLSGGIDSSLLVSLLAKELGVRVETFTVSFGDRSYDESGFAADSRQAPGAGPSPECRCLRHRLLVWTKSTWCSTSSTSPSWTVRPSPPSCSAASCGKTSRWPSAATAATRPLAAIRGSTMPIWPTAWDDGPRRSWPPPKALLRRPVESLPTWPGRRARSSAPLAAPDKQRIFDLLAYNDPVKLREPAHR